MGIVCYVQSSSLQDIIKPTNKEKLFLFFVMFKKNVLGHSTRLGKLCDMVSLFYM